MEAGSSGGLERQEGKRHECWRSVVGLEGLGNLSIMAEMVKT